MNVQRGKRAKANDVIRLPARRKRSFILSSEPFLKSDYQLSWNSIQSNNQIGIFYLLGGRSEIIGEFIKKMFALLMGWKWKFFKTDSFEANMDKILTHVTEGDLVGGPGFELDNHQILSMQCILCMIWQTRNEVRCRTCKSFESIWLWNRTRFFTCLAFKIMSAEAILGV